VYRSAFKSTVVPADKWFGTQLRQHIECIISVVKSKEDFKHCVASLTVLQHKLERVATGAAREPHIVNARVTPEPKQRSKKSAGKKGDEQDADPEVCTKKKSSKRPRAIDTADATSHPKKKKLTASTLRRIGEQCDSIIRKTIRENRGVRDGLVVEVEPDADGKKKSEKWYMTVVDGRLKSGLANSNAALCACRYVLVLVLVLVLVSVGKDLAGL
jgi:hypothetical protein